MDIIAVFSQFFVVENPAVTPIVMDLPVLDPKVVEIHKNILLQLDKGILHKYFLENFSPSVQGMISPKQIASSPELQAVKLFLFREKLCAPILIGADNYILGFHSVPHFSLYGCETTYAGLMNERAFQLAEMESPLLHKDFSIAIERSINYKLHQIADTICLSWEKLHINEGPFWIQRLWNYIKSLFCN